MKLLIEVILGITLGILGFYDWKTKNISLIIWGAGFLIMASLYPLNPNVAMAGAMGGICLGIVILIISWRSRGQIGFGDGLVFCMTGMGMGFWENLNLITVSFIIAGIYAGIGLIIKKLEKEQRIPLVPFITIAYLGITFL